jgi:carbon storage regulator CsrA
MLVLTRSPGQRIVVGGKIKISGQILSGNKIRFMIDAPDDVRVDREEIHERRTLAVTAVGAAEMEPAA